MKYKIGNLVHVRDDLSLWKHYFMDDGKWQLGVVPCMLPYAGSDVMITGIYTNRDIAQYGTYMTDADTGPYRIGWTDEMFEGLALPAPDEEYSLPRLVSLLEVTG